MDRALDSQIKSGRKEAGIKVLERVEKTNLMENNIEECNLPQYRIHVFQSIKNILRAKIIETFHFFLCKSMLVPIAPVIYENLNIYKSKSKSKGFASFNLLNVTSETM